MGAETATEGGAGASPTREGVQTLAACLNHGPWLSNKLRDEKAVESLEKSKQRLLDKLADRLATDETGLAERLKKSQRVVGGQAGIGGPVSVSEFAA